MFYNTPCSKADNEKKIQKSTKPSVYFSFAFESSFNSNKNNYNHLVIKLQKLSP
jgi:hypothetical protein